MWPFKKNPPAASEPTVVDSLIRGYRFCATLQLRTPLSALEMHRKEIAANGPAPVVEPLWVGIWVPVGLTWRELGIPIDEAPPSTIASDIGPVPEDGGDYLQFLLRFRGILEHTPEQAWSDEIGMLLSSNSRYQAFCAVHGGVEAMVQKARHRAPT